jgi:hypothetical protein
MSIQALNWALAQDQIENSATRFVLLILCNYADESGQCYPSREAIAKKTSLSVRSIQNHLNWLSTNGFITWINQRNGSRQSVNVYQVQGEPFALSDGSQSANGASQSANDDNSQGEPFAQYTSLRDTSFKKNKKEIVFFEIPKENTDPSLWNEFLEMRRRSKKPLTQRGYDLLVSRLAQVPTLNLNERLAEAIDRKWIGLVFDNDFTQNGKATTNGHKGCPLCLNSEYVARMSLRPGEIYDKTRNVVAKCKCAK